MQIRSRKTMKRKPNYTIDVKASKMGEDGYIVFKFNSGRFKNESIRIEDIKVEKDNSVGEDGLVPMLNFDYTLLSGKHFKDTTWKLLDKKVEAVMYDILDISVEHAKEVLKNDNI